MALDDQSREVGEELEARRQANQAAESSGRHMEETSNSHIPEKRLEKFGSKGKKPNICMYELDAGSNIYYQGSLLEWTDDEVFVLIPREPPYDPSELWIDRRSPRLWRGLMDMKSWNHIGRGAWKPKAPKKAAGKKKQKQASRKRKASALQDDQLTNASKATNDSDYEVGQYNAMSPGETAASDSVFKGAEPRAHPSLDADDPEISKMSSDGPDHNNEADASGEVQSEQEDDQENALKNWFTGHFQQLKAKNALNLEIADGCNPESGSFSRLPGTRPHEGQSNVKDEYQSSASGRSNGIDEHRQTRTNESKHGISKLGRVGTKFVMDPPRSPSPSTPNKPGDGLRQQSSSEDGDPRSATANASPRKQTQKPSERGRRDGNAIANGEATSEPEAGSISTSEREAAARNKAATKKVKTGLKEQATQASTKKGLKTQHGAIQKHAASILPSKLVCELMPETGKTCKVKAAKGLAASESVQLKKRASKVSALVELDPFAKPEPKMAKIF